MRELNYESRQRQIECRCAKKHTFINVWYVNMSNIAHSYDYRKPLCINLSEMRMRVDLKYHNEYM